MMAQAGRRRRPGRRQGAGGHAHRQLGKRLAELDGADARGVPEAARLRPAALPAGDDRAGRGQPGGSPSDSCGTCGGRSRSWWWRTTPGTCASWPHQHGLRFTVEAYGSPCDRPALRRAGRRADGRVLDRRRRDRDLPGDGLGGARLRQADRRRGGVHRRRPGALAGASRPRSRRWATGPSAKASTASCSTAIALQPWADERGPGMTMGPWGLHYERTADLVGAVPSRWHEYLARCQFLLRQGLFVADICYLQAEAPPQGFRGSPAPAATTGTNAAPRSC